MLAEWLHANSRRADEPFVDLNCGGLTRELLETELFGHEQGERGGTLTGAVSAKTGLLDVAHRGTLFLDEIGDMDLDVQPKLLKVLEEKKFRRIGSVRDRQVDVRLIAATHHDLAQQVCNGNFRADLYYRLSTLPIAVPPMRERVEDIPILARHLLQTMLADLRHTDLSLSPAAERALSRYAWLGNIRELRNVLERAVLLADDQIQPHHLRFDAPRARGAGEDGVDSTLQDVERRHIERVLRQRAGHVAESAKVLAIPRSTLYQKLKQYGIARHTARRPT